MRFISLQKLTNRNILHWLIIIWNNNINKLNEIVKAKRNYAYNLNKQNKPFNESVLIKNSIEIWGKIIDTNWQ